MALLLKSNVHFLKLYLEAYLDDILKILSISNSCLLWHIFGRRILFLKSPLWATGQNIGDIVEILPNKEILVEK